MKNVYITAWQIYSGEYQILSQLTRFYRRYTKKTFWFVFFRFTV